MLTARLLRDHSRTSLAVAILVALAILVPLLLLAAPASSPFHLPAYLVVLFGKYLTFALLAVSIDLIWGFCGILSLGHGAFFALGGYMMGMDLMHTIGQRGANPLLTAFVNFHSPLKLPLAILLALSRSGPARLRVRLPRLPLARQRRLSLHHHAGDDVRAHARLLPRRHGLRRQHRPQRLPIHRRLPRSMPTRRVPSSSRSPHSCSPPR